MMTLLEQIKKEIRKNKNHPKNGAALQGGFEYLENLLLAARGSFTNGYHLEFATPDMKIARNLCDKLAEHDIFANITDAGTSSTRVYIKDSESICTLLALVGATQSLYALNDQIILRSVRNTSNRLANCDAANIERQITSATHQIKVFTKFKNGTHYKTLTPELKETLIARLENPTATYDELSQILGLTKSGVVHRIKRLLQIALFYDK